MHDTATSLLIQRLEKALDLTYDLYLSMEEDNLHLKIGNLPSNSIGEQAWCIIGARESYFSAIKNSKWMGFSCSLKDTGAKKEVVELLDQNKKSILEFLRTSKLSVEQLEFVFQLLEHEIQHHGQLIRFIYSNRLDFPKSWNERYTV